ncbi:MAG: molybdopterin-dependent oxidoreductase [Nitrospirales bacterium]|nr:molybdopterin-dependent oxidoreductase [Nitrospirales bacterium]
MALRRGISVPGLRYRNGARIILADPRRVPMARFSELFLNLRPGTDIPLLNAMAHVILKEGLYNREFIEERTTGFEDWQRSVEDFTPETAERITGVPKGDIIKAARIYGGSRKAGIFYTLGVTQHVCGTENVSAIANLALLTGNIGREHTGINPLRGQYNVQGACDAGCLPNVFPGYQRVELPEIRHKFEKEWGVALPPHDGLKSTEMLPAALKGELKALYIMGENPVITDANQAHTIKALESLDFLVVQDIFLTETAELADVVLPTACFAEKEGTFTNTERKVQRVRKAVEPPGSARDDMAIIVELSALLGYPMDYNSPEDVFEELGRLWPALAGMTYNRLGKDGLQWPCPTRDHPGTKYLYKGGFPRGKVHFTATPYTLPEEVTDKEYPLILTTGRNLFQYHSGSMTRRVASIEVHAGEPYVEISPADSAKLGVNDGETVKVISRRGRIEIKARITGRIPEGIVFVPMHYREAAANVLTNDKALDIHSRTPEYKVCSVRIEK